MLHWNLFWFSLSSRRFPCLWVDLVRSWSSLDPDMRTDFRCFLGSSCGGCRSRWRRSWGRSLQTCRWWRLGDARTRCGTSWNKNCILVCDSTVQNVSKNFLNEKVEFGDFKFRKTLQCSKCENSNMILIFIKQWPLAPNSPKWRITRANVSNASLILANAGECIECQMCRVRGKGLANVWRMYRVRGKWLANVWRMYRVRGKGLANVWRMYRVRAK